jgi:hypothetical protein
MATRRKKNRYYTGSTKRTATSKAASNAVSKAAQAARGASASKSAQAARGASASKSAHRSLALALSGGVLHRHHGL